MRPFSFFTVRPGHFSSRSNVFCFCRWLCLAPLFFRAPIDLRRFFRSRSYIFQGRVLCHFSKCPKIENYLAIGRSHGRVFYHWESPLRRFNRFCIRLGLFRLECFFRNVLHKWKLESNICRGHVWYRLEIDLRRSKQYYFSAKFTFRNHQAGHRPNCLHTHSRTFHTQIFPVLRLVNFSALLGNTIHQNWRISPLHAEFRFQCTPHTNCHQDKSFSLFHEACHFSILHFTHKPDPLSSIRKTMAQNFLLVGRRSWKVGRLPMRIGFFILLDWPVFGWWIFRNDILNSFFARPYFRRFPLFLYLAFFPTVHMFRQLNWSSTVVPFAQKMFSF